MTPPIFAMLMSMLLPGSQSATIHYKSLNPSVGPGVRWSSNVNVAPDSSVWWRWQFSARPGQNFYDVMFWATDSTLRYQTTERNCDDSGSLCGDTTTFSPPIGFGPKTWSGGTQSGSGTSTIIRTNCTGTVAWSWTVAPAQPSEIQTPAIQTNQPIAHVGINENFSGACGTFQWREDWWYGTACQDQNLCIMGPVQSKGGALPYANDASHWYMTFDSFTIDN